MTKNQYIYVVKNLLAPVDKTGRYHPTQIEAVCDSLYAQLMSTVSDELIGTLDIYSKEYTGQAVTLDATKNRYYTSLPVAIVAIPGITSGVRLINSEEGYDLDYVPTTELEMYYADGTSANLADTTIGYWLQGTKVWYDESMTSDIASEGVRMLLIPRFSAYSPDDIVYIPGLQETDFIQKVLQFLAPTVPVDLKANNA